MASTAPIANLMQELGISLDTRGSDQVHSITIGGNNTWTAWHLIPTERPFIAAPEIKTQIVSVPGSDFDLDYTEALDGKVHYHNRTGSWDFIAVPDGTSMQDRYSAIMAAIHGKWVAIALSDDPGWYYVGRVWVKEWKSGKAYSTLTIEYNVQPKKISASNENAKAL